MSNLALSVGQKVELNDSRVGIVRFIGPTTFQTGEWIGVELNEATGKNDGSVQGRRYFECPPAHGIFCRASGVNHIISEPKPKPKPVANGAPAKVRPSSVYGVQAASNGTRRQTLQQPPQDTKGSVQDTPTPVGRPLSGIRSPVKSPTKQLALNGTSSASAPRPGAPSTAAKRPVPGVTGKTSRASISASNTTVPSRRTSTLPPSRTTTTTRQQLGSLGAAPRGPASRPSTDNVGSSRLSGARSGLQQRSAAAKDEPIAGEGGERPSSASHRESSDSDVASRNELEDGHIGKNGTIRNFAPPSMPPVPPDPTEKSNRARRPSSPAATSVHSQKTIRSTAASTRQIEELEAKVRLLERKRVEDRDLRQNLEKAEQDRDQYKGIIEKLQNKYRPQQQEMESLKRELAEYETRFKEIEEIQAKHDVELEAALVDREYAEEQADQYKADLDAVRHRNEELQLELDIAKEENIEAGREMTPEERSSATWLQLEKSNERLREALISLRDFAQDTEADLKEQIETLEEQVKDMEGTKSQFEETREQLARSRTDTEELRQQLEAALGAEDMIERLEEQNQSFRNKITELRAAIEDLESLRELSDELEINHVEAEKQLQEEIDFKDSLLLDRERTAREQQAALDEADYNITRFRELVSTLQIDLQDLQASKQISESEAAQLSDRSRAMMDLNQKLQTNAAKSQVKTIDLELRKLDAQQASEHLSIVQLFLPEAFELDRDSVLALLRVKRIGFKSHLIHGFVKERIGTYGTRGQDEAVFAACDALTKLTWISAVAEHLANSISGCSAEAFAAYGGALYELEVVERTLNDYIDALRRDELKEDDMPVRLNRSMEVMTHLSSLHLHNGLADHADDLIMRAQLLQSRMESTTSALALTRSMLEAHLHTSSEGEESEDESASEIAFILDKLKASMETVRNTKVVSGKTYRALSDLQSRQLTLDESLKEHFESCEAVAQEISLYACQSGTALQDLFGEEGRSEPFHPTEVAAVLSRVATTVFMLPTQEAGPFTTFAARVRDLSGLLADLAVLPTDLDNTVEFERAPAPWGARANELKKTKVTSVDTEAELARAIEAVKEHDSLVKQKEVELEEQSVRIEMLEARMKDASKRSARIAELERSLREAKENETKSKNELAHSRNHTRHEMERMREEMARLAEHRESTSNGKDLDEDAMGASVKITLKRQEYKIAGLEGAVRYLKEDNHRLRLPSDTAPHSITATMDWLQEPLQPSKTSSRSAKAATRREGEKVLEQMLLLAAAPATVDLTKMPENKLAWRPAKESSRWKVEWRNEEWLHWKQRRDGLVAGANIPRKGR